MKKIPPPNAAVSQLPQPKPIPHRASTPPGSLLLHLGEAWYEPSPEVRQAVAGLGAKVGRYPDSLSHDLRQELARIAGHGVTPEQIIIGNGSDGLIDLIVRAYAGPERSVLAPGPTFFAYGHSARLQGAPILTAGRRSQAESFVLNPAALPATPGVLFLANPNNPTGEWVPVETVRSIATNYEGLVVVDECYFEFAGETALPLLDELPNVVVLRSLSKSFALAGLRVGYAIAHPEIIAALERVDQTFTVNVAAQAAGVAALQSLEYYQPLFQETVRLRDQLARDLTTLGLHVFPSAANILLVDYSARTTENVASKLREQDIYVADYHQRGEVQNCIRLAIGSATDNAMLLEVLAQILG